MRLPDALLFACVIWTLCTITSGQQPPLTGRLTIDGSEFIYNNDAIRLNGVNQAWQNYGRDFGGGNYSASALQGTLSSVSLAGGNCVRMWLHCGGEVAPIIANGTVVAPVDEIVQDLTEYLSFAEKEGIFIILSVFNFAAGENYTSIWTDSDLLDQYMENVLMPILEQVSSFNSLAVVELSNEPEGSTAGIPNAGWNNLNMTITDLQRSTNILASAIHTNFPDLLVTQGSWSWQVSTDLYGFTNIYRDDRLIAAGGAENGILDFQQVHSYHDTPGPSPFTTQRSEIFDLDKPLLIGEYSSASWNLGPTVLYRSLCMNGYNGGLGWQANGSGKDSDTLSLLLVGVESVATGCEPSSIESI